MKKMIVRLSDTPNKMYGKPLGLLDGMIKTVENNKEVRILLNAGVIEPATVPVVKVQNIPEDSPIKVQKAYAPIKVKKKVVSKRFF